MNRHRYPISLDDHAATLGVVGDVWAVNSSPEGFCVTARDRVSGALLVARVTAAKEADRRAAIGSAVTQIFNQSSTSRK